MKFKIFLPVIIVIMFYNHSAISQTLKTTKECDEKNYCEIVFVENFKNIDNGWDIRSDDNVERKIIQNKGLLVDVKSDISLPQLIPFKIETNKNFSIETTIDFINGAKNTSYGLVWGFKDWDNMSYFHISANGNFQIGVLYKGVKKRLKEWTFSKEIKQNQNKNTLKILRDGDKMIFTINRTIVHIDNFYELNGDKIGFWVYNNKKLIFENLIIRQDVGNNNNQNIEKKDEWKSTGTGFFIDKKGYITTNYHVIKDATTIEIIYKNKPYRAKVVVSDQQNDLAILKIVDNSFIPLTTLNYNFKIESSEVGTSVFALGFPMTQIMGEEIKFTDGKINAKSGYKGNISTYQISVPIQPGNSGGPLFDNDGNLVGITSSGLDKSLTDNVNYAIKTKYLNLLIEEIDDKIELPKTVLSKTTLMTDKIKSLSKYVVYIKVK